MGTSYMHAGGVTVVVCNGYLEGETGQGAVGADDCGQGDGPGVAHVVVRQQQRAQHGAAGRLQDHVRRDRLTPAHTRINNKQPST